MIKNYLYAIGKYLPPSQRDDILKNIEANIYEYLEENHGEREYTENEIADALYNMGNPKKVAQSYLDKPRYLIGPQYIDTYLLVVKIALLGISIGLAVVSIIKFTVDGNLFMSLLSFFGGVWNGGLVMVGIVTIIFSLVERYDETDSSPFDDKDEKWSLEALDAPPETTNQVKVTDLIFESIFILVLLAFLNHGSALPRIFEGTTIVFMNYEALAPYLFWINLTLGLNLLLNLYLLIKRNWNVVTRLVSIALDLAGIGIFAILALTPDLMDFSGIPNIAQEEMLGIEAGVNLGLKIGLAAIIVITLVEVFKHFRAILRKR